MGQATEAVVFNGLPLLLLAVAYAAVAGAVLPLVWRDRRTAQPLDWAVVLVFPGVATAAAIFAVLVIHDERPLGSHMWFSLAAVLAALAPAAGVLARWRDRAFVVGGLGRAREAEANATSRDRKLEAVAEISASLGRARTAVDAARPLVRQVTSVFGVGFAGVVIVTDDGDEATGVYAELAGEPAPWWAELRIDLRTEPSGIASAVFDAAPVTVFDVTSSPRISARLAAMVGAASGAWIPMIAEERVLGVLVLATTDEKRTFPSDELALLQAIAAEAALALSGLDSAAALSDALEREQRVAEIARRIRAELDEAGIVSVARDELRRTLAASDIRVALDDGVSVTVVRDVPLVLGEQFLVDVVEREIRAALQTARLLSENARRLEQQAALLHAAQVVTSELELETVLERLVQEVTKLLQADAADCYLLDRERGVLRCAAVHGFDPSLVGFEFTPEHGVAGTAITEGRPASSADYQAVTLRVPNEAYDGFARALVAPMMWAGEMRGVLGVGIRDSARTFAANDVELLEAFASLASLGLRNAESFAERSRQARVQRGFYRIASLLGEPVSLSETYDAAAHAAAAS